MIQDDTIVNDHLSKLCLDPRVSKQVYMQCVLEGYPMQLLREIPLQVTARKSIQDVMGQLGVELKNRSDLPIVVGAQSSPKSTLLNYLFGCGCATRAEDARKVGMLHSYAYRTEDIF